MRTHDPDRYIARSRAERDVTRRPFIG
jgi:hypothetical protein